MVITRRRQFDERHDAGLVRDRAHQPAPGGRHRRRCKPACRAARTRTPPGLRGRARQEPGMAAGERLKLGLLIRRDHIVILSQRPAFPDPLIQIQDPARPGGEVGVPGEDPRPVPPRLDRVFGASGAPSTTTRYLPALPRQPGRPAPPNSTATAAPPAPPAARRPSPSPGRPPQPETLAAAQPAYGRQARPVPAPREPSYATSTATPNVHSQPPRDHRVPLAVSRQQDDLRPHHLAMRRGIRPGAFAPAPHGQRPPT